MQSKISMDLNFLNRLPSLNTIQGLERQFSDRSFPGCIGSVPCMNLKWRNCPKTCKGQYFDPKNRKIATVAIEAICDGNLYCWHVFCGRAGTNNDIIVVERISLILDLSSGD